MYRVVGLFLSRLGLVGPGDAEFDADIDAGVVADALAQLALRFEGTGADTRVFLDDEDVTERIRTPEVSTLASRVSTFPSVRKRLVALQREATAALLKSAPGVVVEGRDIGTVVFPHADLKVYMDASDRVRAERRRSELEALGRSEPIERVLTDIRSRDAADTERSLAPLRPADDAVIIDTSSLGFDEQVDRIVDEIERVRARP